MVRAVIPQEVAHVGLLVVAVVVAAAPKLDSTVQHYSVRTGLDPTMISLDRLDQRGTVPDGRFRNTLTGAGPTVGSSRSVIYLIDCGLSLPAAVASELNGAVVEQTFWSAFGTDYADSCNHGTSMAVLLAGLNYGVAPNVRIRNMRATTGLIGGYSGILSALQFLHNNQATLEKGVISMSVGVRTSVPSDVAALQTAINNVVADGFIVVAAAGNENRPITEVNAGVTTQTIPAALNNVITVAGVQYQSGLSDERWVANASLASNYGSEVDLFGPGKQRTRDRLGNFVEIQGTSGATAYTAGAMSTMFQLRPAATNAARIDELYQKASANSVVNNLSPNHRGQLFSDLGAPKLSTTLAVQTETRICPSQSFPTGAPKVPTAQAVSLTSVYVGYTVQRWFGCPGVGVSGGPVDLVIEKYDRATGAFTWRSVLADPVTSNSSLSDFIGDLAFLYNPSGPGRLVVGLASSETGRFAINSTVATGSGVDAYVLALSDSNGTVSWATRLGGPGTDVVKAVVPFSDPATTLDRVVVVGFTTGGFTGASAVLGGVDAFVWRGSGSTGGVLSPAVPILVDSVGGSQRVEDAALGGLYPSLRIIVGGGTDSDITSGAWISPTATAELDAFTYEVDVTSSSTANLIVNRNTFKPASPIAPAIQIDDWVTSVASDYPTNSTEFRYVSTVSRQWDLVSGNNKAYLGTDSVAVARHSASGSPNTPLWVRHLGPFTGSSWNGTVRFAATPEDAYFLAQNSVYKFASETGLQSFVESVSGNPTYAVFADPFLWFGSSTSTSQHLAR